MMEIWVFYWWLRCCFNGMWF